MGILDAVGQSILVGSYVAYAVRSGSSAGMGIGRVISGTTEEIARPYGTQKYYAIKVLGCDQGVYEDEEYKPKKWRLNKRPGVLNTPSRVIVIDPEKMPIEIRDLYEK